jgi:hypothetical protein
MPRSLTFGYNAVLAIDELVVDRFIGAEYDENDIVDSYAQDEFEDDVPVTEAHIFFSKPHIEFDAFREGKNAVLRIDELRVIAFLTLPVCGNPFDFTVSVNAEFSLERDVSTGDLRPHFEDMTEDDVEVEWLDPDPDEEPDKALCIDVIEALMPGIIAQALKDGQFGEIAVPLDIGEEDFYFDAADVVILDDHSIEDKDTLNVALYEESLDETRGHREDITNFMVDGKTFTFRLSRAVFDLLVENFIKTRFMRFEVVITDEVYSENSIRIYPLGESRVAIIGVRCEMHALVAGRIENRTRGQSVPFNTDDSGVFAVTLEAEIGDTLVFFGDYFGDYFSDSSSRIYTKIYPPSLRLRDGYISVSGEAWVAVFWKPGIWIDYDGTVTLDINPVTGQIEPRVDTEIDLVCIYDVVINLFLAFGAPLLYAMLHFKFDQKPADAIRGSLEESGLSSLIPSFSDSNRFVSFMEDIQTQENGIIISGQIDVGSIYNAGRTNENRVELDSAVFQFDRETATVMIRGGHMRREMDGLSFKQLGIDELRNPSDSFPHQTITLPSLSDFQGLIFSVRTQENRYAKIRIDRYGGLAPVIRWITYNPPVEPSIEIVGDWENDGEWHRSRGYVIGGADRYFGTFSLDCTRLHTDGPLQIEWTYEPRCGLLSEEIPSDIFTFISVGDGSGDMRRYLEVRTEDLDDRVSSFSVILTATVTDIFGRTATSTRTLTVRKKFTQRILPPFYRDRRSPWDEPERSAADESEVPEEEIVRESRYEAMRVLRDILVEMATEIDEELETGITRSARRA